jgi:hypothetical protein
MKVLIIAIGLLVGTLVQAEGVAAEVAVSKLAKQYEIKASVLEDFVNSYNFKCPKEISEWQLLVLLDALDEDTELSTMVESDKMDWRDMYVEARSAIACMTDGKVSKGY